MMLNKDPRFPGAVTVTLLIAILLTIIPLGAGWAVWRPEWIVLTLVHWALVIQDRVSLLLAFAVGLVIDNLYGSILGLHALSYVLVTYFSVRLGLRMNAEGFFQQFSLLFVVLGVYMLLNLWIQGMTGNVAHGWAYWVSLLSSVVVWPMYHAVLGYFQAHRKAL